MDDHPAVVTGPVALAMMDILGMGHLLKSRPLELIARQVMAPFIGVSAIATGAIEPALSGMELEDWFELGFRPKFGFHYIYISDTLLILGYPTQPKSDPSPEDPVELVMELARIVAKTIAYNASVKLWLRGAISYGECVLAVEGNLVLLGQPVAEAYIWERRQEWVGAMLAPSAVGTLLPTAAGDLTEDDLPRHFVRYDVPLKPGPETSPTPLVAIDWPNAEGSLFFPRPKLPRLKDFDLSRRDVAEKARNTIRFCRWSRREFARRGAARAPTA